MKRTEIKYVNLLDGKIKILEISNVASIEDIRKNYGDMVADKYMAFTPNYTTISTVKHVKVALRLKATTKQGPAVLFHVWPDGIMIKEHFSEIVAQLKTAGQRLSEIIKANPPEPQEKTIII